MRTPSSRICVVLLAVVAMFAQAQPANAAQADLKQLTSGTWQAKTAGSISQAVDIYFGTRMAGAAAPAGGNRGRQ